MNHAPVQIIESRVYKVRSAVITVWSLSSVLGLGLLVALGVYVIGSILFLLAVGVLLYLLNLKVWWDQDFLYYQSVVNTRKVAFAHMGYVGLMQNPLLKDYVLLIQSHAEHNESESVRMYIHLKLFEEGIGQSISETLKKHIRTFKGIHVRI